MARARRKTTPFFARKTATAPQGGGSSAKIMAGALALLAVLSAVPVASARPSWWLLWTALIGLFGLLWQWRQISRRKLTGSAGAQPLRHYRGFLAAAFIVPLYGVIQSLDIAAFLPQALLSGPGPQAPAISVMPEASFLAALRMAGYLLFLMLVIAVATRRERVQMINRILFWGVTAQAVWALVALQLLGDFSLFGEKSDYRGVATGTFINRNSLATFLGMGLVLGAVIVGRKLGPQEGAVMRNSRPLGPLEKLGTEGLFALIGIVLIALALVQTQSRLGLAASLLGLCVTVLLLWSRSAGFGLRHVALALIGFCVAGVVALVIGAGGVAERALFTNRDSDTRWNLYLQVWEMVRTRPLTGFGLDSFAASFEAFRAPPLLSAAHYNLAHNSYLTLWAELGLVVGSIPPLLLALLAVTLWRKLRAGQDFPAQAAGAIGVLVIGAVHSLGDFSLEIPANNYLFLAILGIGLGLRRATRRKSDEAPVAAPVPPARSGGMRLTVPAGAAL